MVAGYTTKSKVWLADIRDASIIGSKGWSRLSHQGAHINVPAATLLLGADAETF